MHETDPKKIDMAVKVAIDGVDQLATYTNLRKGQSSWSVNLA